MMTVREVQLYGVPIVLDSEGDHLEGTGLEIVIPDLGDEHGVVVMKLDTDAEAVIADEPRAYAYALGALKFRHLALGVDTQRAN